MMTKPALQDLVRQKLDAFDRLQPEFEQCFQYIEDVHGQRRFSSFSLSDIVYYLHAQWICECKTGLLSISKTIKEYDGRLALKLLHNWQEEEDTAGIVDFLNRKLDMLPFADITRQVHEAHHVHVHDGLAQRLTHGRLVLLNRGFNLMQVLDAIFSLSEEEVLKQVRAACKHYGHLSDEIVQQLQEMDSPLYAYVPYQGLAQRNMVVMNKLGVNVTWKPSDLPGQRSWRVLPPTLPESPYAEHIVPGYLELQSPLHNNIAGKRFVDRPDRSDDGSLL